MSPEQEIERLKAKVLELSQALAAAHDELAEIAVLAAAVKRACAQC